MSLSFRVQVTSVVLAASILAIQKPCLAPPCGCACGTADPVCFWNVQTGQPCELELEIPECECKEGDCSIATHRIPLHPKPSAYILTWSEPPGGGCCYTGCGGRCGDYIDVECALVYWCQSDREDWWNCDPEHYCTYHFNHVQHMAGWWTEFNCCCYDAQ